MRVAPANGGYVPCCLCDIAAIVMAPSLLSISSDNPMFALTMSQKVAEYTLALLTARLHHAGATMPPHKER